ncbi:MAG: sugar kinase [Anaerorhabdus sp.]
MDIITIGELIVEMVADKIDQGFDKKGMFHGPFPSGAPAIFIDQAAKCGSTCGMIAAVGNDGFGKLAINKLKSDGVDITNVKILNDQTTGVAFVTYYNDGQRDFIFHIENSASGQIIVDQSYKNMFNDCKYFHIMGSSIYNENIQQSILMCLNLLPEETKITFDPNIRKEMLKDKKRVIFLKKLLEKSHIILAGKDELSFLLESESLEENIDTLFNAMLAEIVVVKYGSSGSTLYLNNGDQFKIDSYNVVEVDPTGAGDCYAGTFISLLNLGYKYEVAAKYASLAGAMAVSKKGPMSGNMSVLELDEIIKCNNFENIKL